MSTVLVFGATGQLGGRIARLAALAGHTVFGVTRGQNLRPTVDLDGVTLLHGDKADETFLHNLSTKLTVDIIIDSVPKLENIDPYIKYFPDVANVLFCSSTGTFVPLQFFPADESHPWEEETPVNFYAQCRRDRHALQMYREKGFPVTILRPTNIIGPNRVPLDLWGGRSIRFFQMLRDHETVLIPDCLDILLQSGHCDDLAAAFVLALDHPDEIRGEIFTVSCKKAITLRRYLDTAMEFLDSHSEIRVVSNAELLEAYPDEVTPRGLEFLLEHMCFDIGKAERILNYRPIHTAEEGLLLTLDHCRQTGLL